MASLYDSASLVMIPSGVKDGKAYSIKPTDGSGDFTFSRGTDTATRVNASGLIEKERGNLLLKSNAFDHTIWGKDDASVTGGQSGYDGSSDAWKLVGNTNTSRHHIAESLTDGGINTFSIYAKASGHNYIQIASASSIHQYANFDLSDGSVGDVGSDFLDGKATSIGGGWYRISVVDKEVTNGMYISLVSSKTAGWLESFAMANATDGVLIQDAQSELGLVATDYIETDSIAVYEGITDNLPRLDYSGGASCPSLLLESSRTNFVPYSEYYDTGWAKVGSSVISNAITSPEGLQNASKLVEDTSTGTHMIAYLNLYNITTGDYYLTLYAKEGERRYLAISSRGSFTNNDNTLIFDTRDGVWTNNDSSQNTGQEAENVGDGWWRIKILNYSGSAAYDGFGVGVANGGDDFNNAIYTGDGTSGIYIYGAQAELGSYPTSYIPTYGTAASRANDYVKVDNRDNIGQSEGTAFIEMSKVGFGLSAAVENAPLSMFEIATSAQRYIAFRANGVVQYVEVLNGTQASIVSANGVYTDGDNVKIAIAYAQNDFVLYVNGTQINSDSSGNVAPCDRLVLGYTNDSTFIGQNKYKQVLLFKSRLTNAELAALTTL